MFLETRTIRTIHWLIVHVKHLS